MSEEQTNKKSDGVSRQVERIVKPQDLQDRKYLQSLINAANEIAKIDGLNSHWKRVYIRLSDAACELDAYIARSSV